jgi:hypothetical protein
MLNIRSDAADNTGALETKVTDGKAVIASFDNPHSDEDILVSS